MKDSLLSPGRMPNAYFNAIVRVMLDSESSEGEVLKIKTLEKYASKIETDSTDE